MILFLSICAIGFLCLSAYSHYSYKSVKTDKKNLIAQNLKLQSKTSELIGKNQNLEAKIISLKEKLQEPDLLKEGIITLSNRQKTILKFGDIIYVKASQNGVQIVTTNEKFIYWKGIGKFIHDLPPSLFIQTHRSYIVNKVHVKAIQSEELKMSNNELVRIGGDYKEKTVLKFAK